MTNAAINDVARSGRTFRAIEGNTGTSAVDRFVRQDGDTWLIAVFNYSTSSSAKTVDLTRAGLPAGSYRAVNLWDGSASTVSGSLSTTLGARQARLFRLRLNAPASLVWAADTSAVWDNGATANWQNAATSLQSDFLANDAVLFDDTAGVLTNVVVNQAVSPGAIVVNANTNPFTLSGAGQIGGSGGLLKQGGSTLALGVAGNFTGPVTIVGGTLKTTVAAALAGAASITISNGAALDFGGNTMPGNKPVNITGAGPSGGGALLNTGNDFYSQVANITLAGDTVFGGTHRWDLTGGSSVSGPFNVILKYAGGYAEWDSVSIAGNVGDIEVVQGAVGVKGMGATFGNAAKTLTVQPGTEINFWNSGTGANSGYAKNIHVQSNAAFKLLTSPNTFFNGNVTLEEGAQWVFLFGSGGQTLNGTFQLNGLTHLTLGDSTVTFTNVISGPGGFVWDVYNNDLVFTASNTYSGPTVIGSGLTLKLSGQGSITHSSLIFFGGNDSTSARMDVSGRSDQKLTLMNGQTLAGVGRINGSLRVDPGATLAPAGTNTTLGITAGENVVGTIAATNAVFLSGATIIKLKGPGTNDVIQSLGAGITYGGTLSLINVSGVPLAAGNSFQIFNADSYAGVFNTITPATPGPGLVWDTTQLSGGKLIVVAAPTPPVVSSVMAVDGDLIFSGTNGVANGNYTVLSSTNMAAPLANWTLLATNAFSPSGTFSFTNPIATDVPQQFYRLRLQ